MKLELKHLAPYLPYGLKYSICNKKGKLDFLEFDLRNTNTLIEAVNKNIYGGEYKPILRPLSDLTDSKVKEMFNVNYSSVKCKVYDGTLNVDVREFNSINLIYYLPHLNKLFEHHFDVFGLIDKGLAININTLES